MSATILAEEMREQPAVVEELLRSQRSVLAEVARLARAGESGWVLIAARGSSDNAARYAQHVLGRLSAPSTTRRCGSSARL